MTISDFGIKVGAVSTRETKAATVTLVLRRKDVVSTFDEPYARGSPLVDLEDRHSDHWVEKTLGNGMGE